MISCERTYKSKAFNERIRFLVLHYTAENLKTSLDLLLGDSVSSHYLVSDTSPYTIFQIVEENHRAWHSGASQWQGRTQINDTSIGIEIVNLGYKYDNVDLIHWYSYPIEQIQKVIELCQNIVRRYNIHPTCVVGHSDISPGRKVDPGPLFPWKKLYQSGVGAWYDKKDFVTFYNKVDLSDIVSIQRNFNKYGYNLCTSGILDEQTISVIKAFQMHFRPEDFSGCLDIETVAILESLLYKYSL